MTTIEILNCLRHAPADFHPFHQCTNDSFKNTDARSINVAGHASPKVKKKQCPFHMRFAPVYYWELLKLVNNTADMHALMMARVSRVVSVVRGMHAIAPE
jgi:hypothetical protein